MMTVYESKKNAIRDAFLKNVYDKCKAEVRTGELNIFVIDDDGNISRAKGIAGVDFQHRPGMTNTFITHKSNLYTNVRVKYINSNNVGYISKSPYYINGLMLDFGGMSTLVIGTNFSCGPTEIRLRDHRDVYIGNDCMFSSLITLWTSDGHTIFNKNGDVINRGGDLVIGDHVWVGHGVKFLKKSMVNDDSVVGSSSLITKQFEEKNVIVAGFPAKVLRQEISWDRKPPFSFP